MPNEIGVDDFKIAFEEALLAVVLSTIPQFFFEYFCIYLIKVKINSEKGTYYPNEINFVNSLF